MFQNLRLVNKVTQKKKKINLIKIKFTINRRKKTSITKKIRSQKTADFITNIKGRIALAGSDKLSE